MPSPSEPPLSEVSIATTAADLRDACAVRAQAYGRHLPQLAASLAEPDAFDRLPGVVVLLARDGAGRAVGTLRIQCASPAVPLPIECSAVLPPALAGQRRAEVTRLAVQPGAPRHTRLLLMKALYLYCVASQVRWLVIGARCEALVRVYRALGFDDLLAPGERVPLAHAGGLPHRVLGFDVFAAERAWRAAGHRLYAFMGETYHPQIRLFGGGGDAFSSPAAPARRSRAPAGHA